MGWRIDRGAELPDGFLHKFLTRPIWRERVETQCLELEQRSTLGEAVERGGVWFKWPRGVANPAPPVFWGDSIEPRLLKPHLESGQYRGMGVFCARGAVVRGEALLADSSGRLLLSDKLCPGYLNDRIEKGEFPKQKRSLSKLERVDLPGVSALVHNLNADTYGHWLVEGLPKLLFLRTLPIRPARFIVYAGAQPHVAKWIQHIAPDVDIETYDPATQYVSCETLLVPTLACSPYYVFNPWLLPLLEHLAPRRRTERLLYLRKPWRGLLHWMENADEVEELAQSLGFEPFSPWKHPLEEQIAAFASARVIAGDYGSALHNSLFSPPQTRVLCFNWVTFMQSRIAQLCRQRVGFQMGDTDAPLTNQGYRVDLDVAKRAFEAALSAEG